MATNYANPSSWTQAYNRTAPTNGDRSGFQYTQRPTYTPYAYNVPTPQSYTPWAVPGTVNFTGAGNESNQQNANQWGAEFGAAQNQWGQQFGRPQLTKVDAGKAMLPQRALPKSPHINSGCGDGKIWP